MGNIQSLGQQAGNLRLVSLQISRSQALCSSPGQNFQSTGIKLDGSHDMELVEDGAQPFISICHGTKLFMNLTAEFWVSNLESWQWHGSWYTCNIRLTHITNNYMLHGSTYHVFLWQSCSWLVSKYSGTRKGSNVRQFLEAEAMYIISTDWYLSIMIDCHYLTLYYLNLSPAYVGEI